MNRHGYITKQEMEEASKVDVEKGLKPAAQLQTAIPCIYGCSCERSRKNYQMLISVLTV